MAMRELLGLESFNISDEEIAQRIREARNKKQAEVVFTTNGHEVRITLSSVDPTGVSQHYYDNP